MLLSTGRKDVLGMVIGGHRINLQYNPLDKKKLTEIFLDDDDVRIGQVSKLSQFPRSQVYKSFSNFLK